jgi:hypothetical protein
MTVTVRWRGAEGDSAWMSCIPFRIRTRTVDAMLANGEGVAVREGPVFVSASMPGHPSMECRFTVEDSQDRIVEFDCAELLPAGHAPNAAHPSKVAVRPRSWAPGKRTEVVLYGDHIGFEIATSSPHVSAAPIAVDLATVTMPRRRMAVPALSSAGDARLAWEKSAIGGFRPRIEPAHPAGRLLMEYLVAGEGLAAATAARCVERLRGAAAFQDWTAPSYTQLLIGYSYAAGRDVSRLRAWCRRTDAARFFGADGRVLAAAAAYWSGEESRARRHLAAVDSPPTVVDGGELALLLTALLSTDRRRSRTDASTQPESSAPEPAISLYGSLLSLMSRVDGEVATVSVLTSQRHNGFAVGTAPLLRRLARRVRFTASGWRYSRVFRSVPLNVRQQLSDKKGLAMAKQLAESAIKPVRTPGRLSPSGMLVAVVAVFTWIAFMIVMLWKAGTAHEEEWTRMAWVFGSAQAVAFSAAGALFGTQIQAGRVAHAEGQAKAATAKAEQHAAAAMTGRAIGTLLQAEGAAAGQPTSGLKSMAPGTAADPAAQLRQRYAQLSKSLYGDLLGGDDGD